MAKKKKSRKKSAAPKPRRRRNPASPKVVYKYKTKARKRRNPRRKVSADLMTAKKLIPDALAVVGGLVATRYAINRFFPNLTGYAKAGAMAAGAVGIGVLAKMALKGKNKRIGNALMIGALAGAAITAFDTATGGSYSSYYSLGAAPKRYYIPQNKLAALPAGRGNVYAMPARSAIAAGRSNFGATL